MRRNQYDFADSRSGGKTTRTLRKASSTLLLLLGCWLLFVPTTVAADALDPQTTLEIDLLLEHIKSAPCRYNRNGNWHEADAAAEHIDRKYRYLLRRDRIDSAEDFIRLSATASSISDSAYLVQCRHGEVMPTADWLTDVLTELRQHESL